MNEIMQKNVKELVAQRNKLKKELFDLRIKNSMRGLTQTHKIKQTRRNIARVNTALHHKLNK
ncbi:50S ribosomal protein L29 [Candidatus Absconditicoccus praedator]|uniref:50S ribosomal protein L29 n=1 Tax=Candidatus Absconditicoccus praedator TaxID=2735562 RepID=UPI001E44CA60|nr:50S ribosomal protein L29 [Candidatus Absconditicoccus praedator]UFX82781.1 50S ribosomal protein L29 [Candidatus Absconditicoccus praedator]